MVQATRKYWSAIVTQPFTYSGRKPFLENIGFRMTAFNMSNALVPSKHINYGPKFYFANSSWPQILKMLFRHCDANDYIM